MPWANVPWISAIPCSSRGFKGKYELRYAFLREVWTLLFAYVTEGTLCEAFYLLTQFVFLHGKHFTYKLNHYLAHIGDVCTSVSVPPHLVDEDTASR